MHSCLARKVSILGFKFSVFDDILYYWINNNDRYCLTCFLLFNVLCLTSIQAGAITEAKLKLSDVSTGIYLCSLIHLRYADFATALLDHWQKYFLTKKEEKVCAFQLIWHCWSDFMIFRMTVSFKRH